MAKIYKRSDRITVKIDDITLKLGPLSMDQKVEVQQAMIAGQAGNVKEATRGVTLSMKYAIKGIDGLEDSDGNPYKLTFDGENLEDSCVDDLLNLEINARLSLVCATMLGGIPTGFTDNNGQPLQGVELIKAASPAKNDQA